MSRTIEYYRPAKRVFPADFPVWDNQAVRDLIASYNTTSLNSPGFAVDLGTFVTSLEIDHGTPGDSALNTKPSPLWYVLQYGGAVTQQSSFLNAVSSDGGEPYNTLITGPNLVWVPGNSIRVYVCGQLSASHSVSSSVTITESQPFYFKRRVTLPVIKWYDSLSSDPALSNAVLAAIQQSLINQFGPNFAISQMAGAISARTDGWYPFRATGLDNAVQIPGWAKTAIVRDIINSSRTGALSNISSYRTVFRQYSGDFNARSDWTAEFFSATNGIGPKYNSRIIVPTQLTTGLRVDYNTSNPFPTTDAVGGQPLPAGYRLLSVLSDVAAQNESMFDVTFTD